MLKVTELTSKLVGTHFYCKWFRNRYIHTHTDDTVLDKSIRRLVRGAAGVRELKIST